MLLNNQQITEEIKGEIFEEKKKKPRETKDNESRMTQNLWDNTKVVVKGKFIPIQLSPQETKKNHK